MLCLPQDALGGLADDPAHIEVALSYTRRHEQSRSESRRDWTMVKRTRCRSGGSLFVWCVAILTSMTLCRSHGPGGFQSERRLDVSGIKPLQHYCLSKANRTLLQFLKMPRPRSFHRSESVKNFCTSSLYHSVAIFEDIIYFLFSYLLKLLTLS